MAWLAVDKNGTECIFIEKPIRNESNEWETENRNEQFIFLHRGSSDILIGKDLTWDDEPVEI